VLSPAVLRPPLGLLRLPIITNSVAQEAPVTGAEATPRLSVTSALEANFSICSALDLR
jgi:hypothetical protein